MGQCLSTTIVLNLYCFNAREARERYFVHVLQQQSVNILASFPYFSSSLPQFLGVFILHHPAGRTSEELIDTDRREN